MVLIIHNGGAVGARNQSVGVAKVLALSSNWGDIEFPVLAVRLWNRRLIPFAAFLIRKGFFKHIGPTGWKRALWHLLFRPHQKIPDNVDWVVTIECNTHSEIGAAALAQFYDMKSAIIRRPKYLRVEDFSLVVSTEETLTAPNAVNMDLVPDHILPDEMMEAGRRLKSQFSMPLWSFLIGGSCKSVEYAPDDYHRMTAIMAAMARRCDIRWLVSTSPRTDDFGAEIVKAFCADHPDIIAQTLFWPDSEPELLAGFIGASEFCFVGEESISMLSSSLSCGIPTYAFAPGQYSDKAIEECYINGHNDERIRLFLLDNIAKGRLARVRDENEALSRHEKNMKSFATIAPECRWDVQIENAKSCIIL